jgi:hypothetical protein
MLLSNNRNCELNINKNNILLKATDTNFSMSQFTMVLNFLKVTDCVKIPALRDTQAEKHVTTIFKCFTISATPVEHYNIHIIWTNLHIYYEFHIY